MATINIEEILKYKHAETRKRGAASGDENLEPAAKKIKKKEQNLTESGSEESVDVLKAIDEEEVEPLDEAAVKKMVLNFEKRFTKNQEMRIKFPEQPTKFMESEVELNVAIQELHALATGPRFYTVLVELNAVNSLLQLISHDNTDISISVIHLLQELTDFEALEETEAETAASLLEALLGGQLMGLLVQNLERLDGNNRDESDGIHNSLAVVENCIEYKADVCKLCVEQGLVNWLMKRVRQKGPFDGNKLYASELLGVVLQGCDEAKEALGSMDGIDILLQALAAYKRHNPGSVDEREFMENLFNALCASLLHIPNRKRFLDGEGLQLMNLMLRERKESRSSALKVLDYAMTGPEGAENCDKFVEILGLRTLFPLFMKVPKVKRRGESTGEHEEHVTAVVGSLLRGCSAANRVRVMEKFLEQDLAKTDRLMELYFKYSAKIRNFEEEQMERAQSSEERDEEELYLKKLDAGLFTLQLLCLILLDGCVSGPAPIRHRVAKIMSMRGGHMSSLKTFVQEYLDNLGAEATDEKQRVANLLNAFSALD